MRSYLHYCIGSHQNSVVKCAWARVVLGWVTSWEVLVLHIFLVFVFFYLNSGASKSISQNRVIWYDAQPYTAGLIVRLSLGVEASMKVIWDRGWMMLCDVTGPTVR